MNEKRYLVIARVGDGSLHHEWLEPAVYKNFDLCLSYYGDQPGRYANECDYYFVSKGTKWPKLYELIEKFGHRIFEYDAIWFPDDDISTNAVNINNMFRMFSEHGLMLAQPALTKNAFFQVTVQHKDYHLRYTHFVEVMVPIFSREALQICWPSFNKNLTGWGLEYVWAKLLGYPHKKMAVIDDTPVIHTRPPGTGELYNNIRLEYDINVWENNELGMLAEYGLTASDPNTITFYDGIKKWSPVHSVPIKKKIRKSVVRKKETKHISKRTNKRSTHHKESRRKVKKSRSGLQKKIRRRSG